MERTNPVGHLAAGFTILLWGTTFISTKVLLVDFTPIEILFIRFVMGYLALFAACPRLLKLSDKKQEWLFVGAGITGVTLYYLMENIALTFTMASNVGVIVSVSPFFTTLASCVFLKEKRPGPRFFVGLVFAMAGICLLSFGGGGRVEFNPAGDILAVGAAVVWAFYSVLTKKIAALGHSTVATTRHIFFYGLLFMTLALPFMGFEVGMAEVTKPVNLFNLLFLGLGASAMCFVTWNLALKYIGPIRSSVYIYGVPVITTVCSALILKEPVGPAHAAGIALTITGLMLSQEKQPKAGKTKTT